MLHVAPHVPSCCVPHGAAASPHAMCQETMLAPVVEGRAAPRGAIRVLRHRSLRWGFTVVQPRQGDGVGKSRVLQAPPAPQPNLPGLLGPPDWAVLNGVWVSPKWVLTKPTSNYKAPFSSWENAADVRTPRFLKMRGLHPWGWAMPMGRSQWPFCAVWTSWSLPASQLICPGVRCPQHPALAAASCPARRELWHSREARGAG